MSEDADNKMALPPGTVLHGKYRLGSVLGHGGFGITYKARDMSISREVAIKECLPADFAWREGTTVLPKATQYKEDYDWARERFKQEAKILAQFDHPAIVKVYDIFEANGTSYMVTRYEPGWTLPTYLQAMGRTLYEQEIGTFLDLLLDGLEQVHEAGYLHRDIKPDNIYITEHGQSFLLDFGSARQAVSNRSRPMTSVLTPGYAPFEQYHEDGNQGPWTDLYALAACIHEMLRGKPPPDATRRERNDPYEPLAMDNQLLKSYERNLLVAIDQCLSPNESHRPQSVPAVREVLDRVGSEPEKEDTEPKSEDAESLFEEAKAYYYGRGRSKDDAKAVYFFRKAAEQGHAEAQFCLGYMYREGVGIPQDDAKAVEWYRKAAEQGQEKAQFGLGWMYDQGRGVSQDASEAVEWYHKAAEQGNAVAQLILGVMNREGRGVAQYDFKAAEWTRKAAEQGHAGAQYNLGRIYEEGTGVAQDDVKAVEWWRKAAEQGHAMAQSNLGFMYRNGKGVAQDDAKAVEWYRKAAERGVAVAQSDLGFMYGKGRGVVQDEVKAVEWSRKSAEQGHAIAQFNLGNMYREGRGVAQDEVKAVEWYRKAADQGHQKAKEELAKQNPSNTPKKEANNTPKNKPSTRANEPSPIRLTKSNDPAVVEKEARQYFSSLGLDPDMRVKKEQSNWFVAVIQAIGGAVEGAIVEAVVVAMKVAKVIAPFTAILVVILAVFGSIGGNSIDDAIMGAIGIVIMGAIFGAMGGAVNGAIDAYHSARTTRFLLLWYAQSCVGKREAASDIANYLRDQGKHSEANRWEVLKETLYP